MRSARSRRPGPPAADRAPAGGPGPEPVPDLLFVYGTLMRGFPLHGLLARGAAYLGRGRIGARLFDLGRYPAAVPDAAAGVWGEVYRVADPTLWRALDSAEGPQYHRQGTTVRLARGRRVQASVYWYRGPLGGAVPVPGGDYRAHGPARALHLIATHQEETDGP